MENQVNPYVSVDCVILGFDGMQLNVLVVRQCRSGGEESTGHYKLPGSLLYMDENLDEAAYRVLKQLTGLTNINMMQFHAFGDVNRLKNEEDSMWLERFHHLEHHLECIVTIAYAALVRIDRNMTRLDGGYEATWIPVAELPKLAFDHNEIVKEAIVNLKNRGTLDPSILFDLLPKKFTASQLRVMMESVLETPLDMKNFHKKMAQMPYVVPLDEKEVGVSHRAARYFKFRKPKKNF